MDIVEQLIAAEHLLWVLNKRGEQVELARGELDQRATGRDQRPSTRIEHPAGEVEAIGDDRGDIFG